jgi:hypothetical protein
MEQVIFALWLASNCGFRSHRTEQSVDIHNENYRHGNHSPTYFPCRSSAAYTLVSLVHVCVQKRACVQVLEPPGLYKIFTTRVPIQKRNFGIQEISGLVARLYLSDMNVLADNECSILIL